MKQEVMVLIQEDKGYDGGQNIITCLHFNYLYNVECTNLKIQWMCINVQNVKKEPDTQPQGILFEIKIIHSNLPQENSDNRKQWVEYSFTYNLENINLVLKIIIVLQHF